MKKTIALLLVIALMLSLAVACAAAEPETATDEWGTYSVLPEGTKAVKLVYGDDGNEGSIVYQASHFLSELLNERSNGLITMEVHNSLTIGTSTTDLFQSVQNGDIDMCGGSAGAALLEDFAAFDLPGLYTDWDKAWAMYTDSPARDKYEEICNNYGVELLFACPKSYRELTSNKEITTVENIKGLDLRLPSNPAWITFWSNMGANTMTIAMSEVYMALQQGTCVAQENSYDQIVTNNLLEVQKYLIFSNHVLDSLTININKDRYDSLDENVKALIEDCIDALGKWAEINVPAVRDSLLDQMQQQAEKYNDTIIYPDEAFYQGLVDAMATLVPTVRSVSADSDELMTLCLEAMGRDGNLGK